MDEEAVVATWNPCPVCGVADRLEANHKPGCRWPRSFDAATERLGDALRSVSTAFRDHFKSWRP